MCAAQLIVVSHYVSNLCEWNKLLVVRVSPNDTIYVRPIFSLDELRVYYYMTCTIMCLCVCLCVSKPSELLQYTRAGAMGRIVEIYDK